MSDTIDSLAEECRRLADYALKCAIEVGGMSTGMEVEWVKARAPLLAAIDRLRDAARAPQQEAREADSRSLDAVASYLFLAAEGLLYAVENGLPHGVQVMTMRAACVKYATRLRDNYLAAPSGVPQDSARGDHE
jgi:hypothetical protein